MSTDHIVTDQQPTKTNNNDPQISESNRISHRDASGNIISLLNFDPNTKSKRFISSPRSKEAMKRLCLEDHELVMKSKEDFFGQPLPAEFAEDKDYFYEVKAEHYEKRRKEKIKMAIQERQAIIKQESNPGANNSVMNSEQTMLAGDPHHQSSYSQSNFFSQGHKKLQQMRNQQKKEIDMIIHTELRTQEMMKKNEDKVAKLQELEQKRMSEVEKKQLLAEEKKRLRDLQKLEREKEQEEINRAIQEKREIEEQRRAEVQERLRIQREAEVAEREKERLAKHEVREKRIEELEIEKKEYIEKKTQEKDVRFDRIRKEQEDQHRRKQIQSVQARRHFEMKIETVRRKVEDEREEQRRKVFERQLMTNEKKERMEEEKRRELEERRNRSEVKVQEIRKTLEEKFAEEQARKEAYLEKYKKAEENKRQKESESDYQRRLKIQREQEKEFRIKQTLVQKDEKVQEKNQIFLETLTKGVFDAQYRKEQKIKEDKKKFILDILRMEDAEENNKRLEKVRENKRAEFTEKIHHTAQRLQQVQAEKDKAYFEKKKLQSQLESEKSQILKDFEKKKKLLLANRTQSDNISFDVRTQTPAAEVHSAQITSAKSVAKLAPLTTSNKMAGSNSVKNLRGGSVTRKSVDKSAGKSPLGLDYQFQKSSAPGGSRLQSKPVVTKTENSVKTTERKPESKPQSQQRHTGAAAKTFVVKEDAVINDLQTQEYSEKSAELRNANLGELLKLIDNAVKNDQEVKQVDSNIKSIAEHAQKQEESVVQLRAQNNYLLLA